MNMKKIIVNIAIMSVISSMLHAYTKQEVVNAITKAAHAYWDQKVVINHPAGTFYGYSGAQTVVDPADPNDRYYSSDWGWLPQPHIFMEWEDTPGHAGAAYGFLRAYQATGDIFLKRAAKQLGDTLLSAQKDNGVGGWFYDMGVIGYDRQPGSPTYNQTIDYGKWVNLYPFGGQGNVMNDYQNIGSFDGVSWMAGFYLLRLYQALPANEPGRDTYLQGAQWLADTIVDFKDVIDNVRGFKPYGDGGGHPGGGIPQLWPYNTMLNRPGVDSNASYPYSIPHNVMPTLNDHAMVNALFYLIEFWQEAQTNPQLDEQKYLDAVRLNIDYLIYVFRLNANASTGRGSWASQYWVNDGSTRACKPTWGRTLEPPCFGWNSERADELLLKWLTYETDQTKKQEITDVLTKFYLYFKYDAPPVNSTAAWRDAIRPYIRGSQYLDRYDPNDTGTWQWWIWYNHDPNAVDRFGNTVPLNVFVGCDDAYNAYYGDDALVKAHNHDDHYGYMRGGIGTKMKIVLVEPATGQPYLDLYHQPNDKHNASIIHYFNQDTTLRMFRGWEDAHSRVDQALSNLDPNTGFFLAKQINRNGKDYAYVEDYAFQTRMRFLAWGFEQATGTLSDSDGDGIPDSQDQFPNDSSNMPNDPNPNPDPGSNPDPDPNVIPAQVPDVTSLQVQNNIIKKSENTSADIQCNLEEAGNLSVIIYDAKGKEIVTLCNEHKDAGVHTFNWPGKDSGTDKVGSGIYIVYMQAGGYTETKKIAVVK